MALSPHKWRQVHTHGTNPHTWHQIHTHGTKSTHMALAVRMRARVGVSVGVSVSVGVRVEYDWVECTIVHGYQHEVASTKRWLSLAPVTTLAQTVSLLHP